MHQTETHTSNMKEMVSGLVSLSYYVMAFEGTVLDSIPKSEYQLGITDTSG